MKLIPLPAFTDNYIWMLQDGREALLADPGDEQPALDVLQQLGVQLGAILVTHLHADHTSGQITHFCANVGAAPLLFRGDTLFGGGRADLLKGSPAPTGCTMAARAIAAHARQSPAMRFKPLTHQPATKWAFLLRLVNGKTSSNENP